MPEAIREGDIPGVQLRRRRPLPISPAEAWLWLIEPERLGRWLADEAEVTLGTRGGLVLTILDPGGARLRERGTTREMSPPSRWLLDFTPESGRWGTSTRLELAVHPHESGAEIDIRQSGFQRLPLSLGLTAWETYRRRWWDALDRLEKACAPAATD
ncbi:MAG TPA: SRPBCC domain-containing protein [Thermoanaerobaculia bacterium]|nr:SRPBCC domain-containing protein [Thermoanaerobaculia bacterium]